MNKDWGNTDSNITVHHQKEKYCSALGHASVKIEYEMKDLVKKKMRKVM
jgi:hypothetical protein